MDNNQLTVQDRQRELLLLRSNSQEYISAIQPSSISECITFGDTHNNLSTLCKQADGKVIKELLAGMIIVFLTYKGQPQLDDECLLMLVDDIVDDCWMLNLADFKMCLKMHRGDKVYGRLSAGDILGMFQDYREQRYNTADDMSYQEHMQTKAETNISEGFDLNGLANKFSMKAKSK